MRFIAVLMVIVCLIIPTSCASTGVNNLKRIDLESDVVVMYSTDWCHVCVEAKTFLEHHRVEYIELDYENELEFKRLLQIAHALDYNGVFEAVPVFIVRKNILVGYSPETILWILGEGSEDR